MRSILGNTDECREARSALMAHFRKNIYEIFADLRSMLGRGSESLERELRFVERVSRVLPTITELNPREFFKLILMLDEFYYYRAASPSGKVIIRTLLKSCEPLVKFLEKQELKDASSSVAVEMTRSHEKPLLSDNQVRGMIKDWKAYYSFSWNDMRRECDFLLSPGPVSGEARVWVKEWVDLKGKLTAAVEKYIKENKINTGSESSGAKRARNFKAELADIVDLHERENQDSVFYLLGAVVVGSSSRVLKKNLLDSIGLSEEEFGRFSESYQAQRGGSAYFPFDQKAQELEMSAASDADFLVFDRFTLAFKKCIEQLGVVIREYQAEGCGKETGKRRAARVLDEITRIQSMGLTRIQSMGLIRELVLLLCAIIFKSSSKELKKRILTNNYFTENSLDELKKILRIGDLAITQKAASLITVSNVLPKGLRDLGPFRGKLAGAITNYINSKKGGKKGIARAEKLLLIINNSNAGLREIIRAVYLLLLTSSGELKRHVLAAIDCDEVFIVGLSASHPDMCGDFCTLTLADADFIFSSVDGPSADEEMHSESSPPYSINNLASALMGAIRAEIEKKKLSSEDIIRANNLLDSLRKILEAETLVSGAATPVAAVDPREREIALLLSALFRVCDTALAKPVAKLFFPERPDGYFEQTKDTLKRAQSHYELSNYEIWKAESALNQYPMGLFRQNLEDALNHFLSSALGTDPEEKLARQCLQRLRILDQNYAERQPAALASNRVADFEYFLAHSVVSCASAIASFSSDPGNLLLKTVEIFLSRGGVDGKALNRLFEQYGASITKPCEPRDYWSSIVKIDYTPKTNRQWGEFKAGLALAVGRYIHNDDGYEVGQRRAKNFKIALKKMNSPLTEEDEKWLIRLACAVVFHSSSKKLSEMVRLCTGVSADCLKILQAQFGITDAICSIVEKQLEAGGVSFRPILHWGNLRANLYDAVKAYDPAGNGLGENRKSQLLAQINQLTPDASSGRQLAVLACAIVLYLDSHALRKKVTSASLVTENVALALQVQFDITEAECRKITAELDAVDPVAPTVYRAQAVSGVGLFAQSMPTLNWNELTEALKGAKVAIGDIAIDEYRELLLLTVAIVSSTAPALKALKDSLIEQLKGTSFEKSKLRGLCNIHGITDVQIKIRAQMMLTREEDRLEVGDEMRTFSR